VVWRERAGFEAGEPFLLVLRDWHEQCLVRTMRRLPRFGLKTVGRGLVIALALVVGLELVYALAANIILKTSVLEGWLNVKPETLKVTYQSAWSLIPGRVNVRGLSIRNQDSSLQFLLEIDEATADIELLEVTQRRFHVTRVTASGTRFRVRNRVARDNTDQRRLAAYPPIEGFTDPPLEPWNLPDKKLGSRPFTIELENVDATLSELWVVEYRYVGPGRARGGFRLVPGKRVRVGPVHLELASGALTAGAKQKVASRFSTKLTSTIQDFDVKAVKGRQVFDQISAHGSLDAQIESLAFAELYLPPKSPLRFQRGNGRLKADIRLERGRLLPKSSVQYATERISLEGAPVRVSGDAKVMLAVEQQDKAAIGKLDISASSVEMAPARGGADTPPIRAERPELQMLTHTLGASETWRVASGKLRIPAIEAPDLRVFNAFAETPRKFTLQGGSGQLSARADVDDKGKLSGHVAATVKKASAAIGKNAIYVTGKASADINQDHANTRRGKLSAITADLNPVIVQTKDGTANVSVRVENGTVAYREFVPRDMRAVVRARAADAEPIFAAIGIDLSTLPKMALSVLDTSNLRVTAEFSHSENATNVRLREARTNGLQGQGSWRKEQSRTRGAFLLDLPAIDVGVSLKNSESNVKLFADREWLSAELHRLGLRNGH
jgi:hypothetical protein